MVLVYHSSSSHSSSSPSSHSSSSSNIMCFFHLTNTLYMLPLPSGWFKHLDSSTVVNPSATLGLKHGLCTVFSTIFSGFLGVNLLS